MGTASSKNAPFARLPFKRQRRRWRFGLFLLCGMLLGAGLPAGRFAPPAAAADRLDLTSISCAALEADLDRRSPAGEDWLYGYLLWLHGYTAARQTPVADAALPPVPLGAIGALMGEVAVFCTRSGNAKAQVAPMLASRFRQAPLNDAIVIGAETCARLIDVMDSLPPAQAGWQPYYLVMWSHGWLSAPRNRPAVTPASVWLEPEALKRLADALAADCRRQPQARLFALVEAARRAPLPPPLP